MRNSNCKIKKKNYLQVKKWLANDLLHRRLLNYSQKVPRKKKKKYHSKLKPNQGWVHI